MRLLAGPMRVGLQRDRSARLHVGDAIGAVIETGIGGVGVEARAPAIGLGVLFEARAFQMRRDEFVLAEIVVGEGDAVRREDQRLGIGRVDLQDAAIAFARGDARARMLADFPGQDRVVGDDRLAVAPIRVRLDAEGDFHAFLAVGQGHALGAAVFDGRQFHAHKANELPILVVGRHRPAGHAEHVALGRHRIDHRMEGRGELRQADRQFVLGFGREGQSEQGEGDEGGDTHP